MNVLFLTLSGFDTLKKRNIYTDLLREFVRNGHDVYIISPIQKRNNGKTHFIHEDNAKILRLLIGDTTNTNNFIKKGISTVWIEWAYTKAIKTYFGAVPFDLVLYSTPPITLAGAVNYVKHRDNAKTYLLLKDIFPQNAVDLGMMHTSGIKSFVFRYFRQKEKKLYAISDRIGCMSRENVRYLLAHNPEIDPENTEVCPNSVEPVDMSIDEQMKYAIRVKYDIPLDKTVFIYGGNLGKPQGIPFLIECLQSISSVRGVFFLIVGSGTEYGKLKDFVDGNGNENIRLMSRMEKGDYDIMVGACDVGLIFLDHRFTIPNFPSRILAYMQAKLPVLACTDPNTDIGKIITDAGFGWWCESNCVDGFKETVEKIVYGCFREKGEIDEMGARGWEYLNKHYRASSGYEIIVSHF